MVSSAVEQGSPHGHRALSAHHTAWGLLLRAGLPATHQEHPAAHSAATFANPLSQGRPPLCPLRHHSLSSLPEYTLPRLLAELSGMISASQSLGYSEPALWLSDPHPWRHSRVGWMGPWAARAGGWQSCPQQRIGAEWTLRSLLTQCNSAILRVSAV